MNSGLWFLSILAIFFIVLSLAWKVGEYQSALGTWFPSASDKEVYREERRLYKAHIELRDALVLAENNDAPETTINRIKALKKIATEQWLEWRDVLEIVRLKNTADKDEFDAVIKKYEYLEDEI